MRLGADANHRFTAFGPANVTMYQVSIAQVLGDCGTAIEHAKTLRPAAMPTPGRQGRYWIDVASSPGPRHARPLRHASDRMCDEVKAALQVRWEESLTTRAAIHPRSPVPLLDDLRAPHRDAIRQSAQPAAHERPSSRQHLWTGRR
jgi:hypothetical protein